ncbi:MAG TPA: TIGR03086 family metal-binding protein [Nakamurella sp.]
MLVPFYRSAVRQFDSRIRAVGPGQWTSSTPDDEWDVQRLVRHVVNVQNRFAGGFGGRSTGATSATGAELVDAWAAASAGSVAVFEAITDWSVPAPLPSGHVSSLEDLGWLVTADLAIHAWDVARAVNAPDELPNDLVSAVLERAKVAGDRWLRPEAFAPPIPVPGCTDDLTELLALSGRRRWWRRT